MTMLGNSTGDQYFPKTNEELVMSKMKYPDKCVIRKGWFPDTAKGLESLRFAFVSIDADLFEPIMNGLEYFYSRLSLGGFLYMIIITGSIKAVQKR